MNKIQIKDAQQCEDMLAKGEDMECFSCSCNVCIANIPDEVETYKRQLFEKLELIKEDIPHSFCSVDETYGARKTLDNIIGIIKGK